MDPVTEWALALGSLFLVVAVRGSHIEKLPFTRDPIRDRLWIERIAQIAICDPVPASDVEVERPADRDPLRFTFTAEAALNDCTAAPFLALGLGVLSIGHDGSRWMWTTLGGLAIGAVTGASSDSTDSGYVHIGPRHHGSACSCRRAITVSANGFGK
jgi:hypothetical protein